MAEGKTQNTQNNNSEKLKVFISYSRTDEKFADELVDGLNFDGGFDVTIDRHSIKHGEKWKPRLGALIEAADTVVFILSPASVSSEICQWEVDEAARLSKRILPVLYHPLGETAPPKQLGEINYLDFTGPQTLMGGIKALSQALREDQTWLKESTRLLNLALQWHKADQRKNRLLSGEDITDAKHWLATRPSDTEITELQRDFIKASEEEEQSRNDDERKRLEQVAKASKRVARRTMAGLLASIMLAILAGWLGLQAFFGERKAQQQTKIAEEKTRIAEQKTKEAERQTKIAQFEKERANKTLWQAQLSQSKFLTKQAMEQMDQNLYGPIPALLALEALPDPKSPDKLKNNRPYWPLAHKALLRAEQFLAELNTFNGFRTFSLAISANGNFFATTSGYKIKLYSIETGLVVREFKAKVTTTLSSIAFSPNGKYIVSGSRDKKVLLWSVATGKLVKLFRGHKSDVITVAFSNDGQFIISGSHDRTIRLWSVETGKEIRSFKGHNESIKSVAISPDGQYIVSGSLDKTIRLWSVVTGQELHLFKGHKEFVTSIAISPDGKYIASGSWDKTVRLWSVESGQEIRRFSGHLNHVNCIAFSPDGKFIISGSQDKTLSLWSLESDQLVKKFKSHLMYYKCGFFAGW